MPSALIQTARIAAVTLAPTDKYDEQTNVKNATISSCVHGDKSPGRVSASADQATQALHEFFWLDWLSAWNVCSTFMCRKRCAWWVLHHMEEAMHAPTEVSYIVGLHTHVSTDHYTTWWLHSELAYNVAGLKLRNSVFAVLQFFSTSASHPAPLKPLIHSVFTMLWFPPNRR